MKIKHLISLVVLFTILTSCLLPSKSLATSWAYPFVVWDGYIYVVSDEYVTEINREIGKVTKYSDMEQHTGNFSNAYKEGTKYYSIEGISTDQEIAVQDEDGSYKKAFREREYTYAGESFDLAGIVIGFLTLCLIATYSIYIVKKRGRK